ncbi:MAG: hypothetical protein KME45_22645 [Stenomitos rutilans HA7619-LM2]|jgi:hypothetical protein|nr:hypothetical protein [Stenomitos rutilans HA7619-LM2]
MAKMQQPLPWVVNESDSFISMIHEGKVVGFCQPAYARHVVKQLNEAEQLYKALELACYDLTARSGGSTASVGEIVQQYLSKATRPKSGTAAIVMLLQHRQEDLDLTDAEFAKFCDTFRLSRAELQAIYLGEDIEHTQLSPLARILGLSMDELIDMWRGGD